MAVAQQVPVNRYTGNGVATVYPTNFKALAKTDVAAYIDGVQKVLDADYTVSNLGVDAGCTVTWISGAPANATNVVIARQSVKQRLTDYQNLGDFNTSVVNPDFDNPVLMIQELQEQASRALTLPITDSPVSLAGAALGSVDNRKGKYLFFNAITGAIEYAAALIGSTLSQSIIGQFLNPQTPSEAAAGVTPTNYWYPAYNAKRYGATGDGVTDDSAALQRWLNSIPASGEGVLPAATSFYKYATGLTRTGGFVSIRGDGVASRAHYTGSGVALTLTDPRFSTFTNWYLTGTSSATGGVWVKGANEGFGTFQFFADGFTGASAYAMRCSDTWDANLVGGALRQSTNGLICDTTDLGDGGVSNTVSLLGVDMSECGISVDFQAGQVLTAINVDTGNGGGVVAPVCAFEIGRGLSGSKFVSCVNIIGCWGEGTGSFLRVGRNNTSSIAPKFVNVQGSHIDVLGEMVRIYKGDLCTIGENEWGGGTITIDAGVTRSKVETIQSVTDNSTAGQTTYVRQSDILIPTLQTYMSRLHVTRNGVDQSIPTGAPTKVQWTTEDLDTLGTYDNATNFRVTPTKGGWYRARAQVTMSGMADGNFMQLSIYKNGTRHRTTNLYASAASSPSVQVDALVNANGSTDYFEVFIEHNNGGAKNALGAVDSSWFEFHPAV
jgi:hypothetical protein